jgi:hypothetical protein
MRGKTLIITAMIMVVIFMGTTSATGQTGESETGKILSSIHFEMHLKKSIKSSFTDFEI